MNMQQCMELVVDWYKRYQTEDVYGLCVEEINKFIEVAKEKPISFESLINRLTGTATHIGIRAGIIPIYVAVVLSKISNNVVIKDSTTEVKLNAETICAAIENPSEYFLTVVSWSKDKTLVELKSTLSLISTISNQLFNWITSLAA